LLLLVVVAVVEALTVVVEVPVVLSNSRHSLSHPT
jgi:hypothetical protein